MFAARNVKGTWYLCIRRGRLIRTVKKADGTDDIITFSSQAKAKACADELNETYLKTYEDYISREGLLIGPRDDRFAELQMGVLDVINQYRQT